jgi:hypothetical protein
MGPNVEILLIGYCSFVRLSSQLRQSQTPNAMPDHRYAFQNFISKLLFEIFDRPKAVSWYAESSYILCPPQLPMRHVIASISLPNPPLYPSRSSSPTSPSMLDLQLLSSSLPKISIWPRFTEGYGKTNRLLTELYPPRFQANAHI